MKKLAGLLLFLALWAIPAAAQDVPVGEISGAYSLRRYTQGMNSHLTLHGWDASGEYNIWHSWLGVAGDFSGTYKTVNCAPFSCDYSIYSGMVGPRLYPLGHRKLTLFGDGLVGGAVYKETVPRGVGFPSFTNLEGGLSWAVGGGADLNIWKHWGIRVFQVDFGMTKFFYASQTNVRLSFGFVYRFGEK